MPQEPALAVLSFQLEGRSGNTLHRNFTTFLVGEGLSPRDEVCDRTRVLRFAPNSFAASDWSDGQWEILGGLKVSAAGAGFLEYRIPWPSSLSINEILSAGFHAEISAKELLSKDRQDKGELGGDYMRGGGVDDRTLNPNAYPMTDEATYPTTVRVRLNGIVIGIAHLEDDPADHRGVLSWFSQKKDRRLREAGSYGYLTEFGIPPEALTRAQADRQFVLRLEVDESTAGGIAVYGERFGRYPLDPTLSFALKK